MSSIPTHIASGLAATSLAQSRGAEADRVRQEDAVRQREASGEKSAEAAAGIDETKDQQASGDRDADAGAIARTIDAYHVAYLLIDQERYANAPPSPLARFVARFPERVRKVRESETDRSAVTIYEVEPAR